MRRSLTLRLNDLMTAIRLGWRVERQIRYAELGGVRQPFQWTRISTPDGVLVEEGLLHTIPGSIPAFSAKEHALTAQWEISRMSGGAE
jgi:hypothetical protein